MSFANDVLPILQSRCVRCHGEDRVEEGLLMRTYEEIMGRLRKWSWFFENSEVF